MRALIMVLLIIINVRDHETDSAPGIRTILAHFGRRAGWIEFLDAAAGDAAHPRAARFARPGAKPYPGSHRSSSISSSSAIETGMGHWGFLGASTLSEKQELDPTTQGVIEQPYPFAQCAAAGV